MIIFFQKILNKFKSKDYTKHIERIYKIKSGHVTTKPLLDKVNCKSTILSRMIDTIKKRFLTIKQLIELNLALNQIIK